MKVKLGPVESIKHLSTEVSKRLKADVVFYSGDIGEPSDYELIGRLTKHAKHPNCLLILTTYGGVADSAFRMMRFLQNRYKDGKISAFVPHVCKSAGTLMVVGADELVMSGVSELGPLDVQVLKPDELGERVSGLTPMQALTALRAEAFNCFEQHFLMLREKSGRQITAKTAADIAVRLTTGWFQPLYEQVDPMRLGDTTRAMNIAYEYGTRLAGSRGNIDQAAIHDLISGYPQHGFIIDRDEAARLFKKVRAPHDTETKLAQSLIASKLVDGGMNSDRATIRIISEENCDLSDDNAWEGIEYEEDEPPAKKDAASRRNVGGANAGKGHEKSVPPTPSGSENGVSRQGGGKVGGAHGDKVARASRLT